MLTVHGATQPDTKRTCTLTCWTDDVGFATWTATDAPGEATARGSSHDASTDGSPKVTAEATGPGEICVMNATTEPWVAWTSVASSPPWGTREATWTEMADCGPMTSPWAPCGVAAPFAPVMKVIPATAGVELGLTKVTTGSCPLAEEFPAKYHDDEVVDEHGVSETPFEPSTRSVTATPPPWTRTVAAAKCPEDTMSPGWIDAVLPGATSIVVAARAPASDAIATVARTVAPVVLTIEMVAWATEPAPTLNPPHVNCEVSAVALATRVDGCTGAVACAVPPTTHAPIPIATSATARPPTMAGRCSSARASRR